MRRAARGATTPGLPARRRPPEQRERQRGTPDRDAEARAHAQEQGEGPVAPAAIFLHLIQLSERIEPGEQWAEAEQDEGVARVERAARGGPAGKRRERPEAHMLITQSTPATALNRNGGTE